MLKTSSFRTQVVVVSAVVFLCSGNQSVARDRPVSVSSKQKDAANLYLMRNLEHILSTWKSPKGDLVELGVWVRVTRSRLISRKKTAEAYGLDGDIVNAYDDMLRLLQEYDDFLKDIVLFDLVANVARPERKDLYVSVVGSAITVGSAGAYIGTTFPVVGNIAGTAVGAVAGGVKGLCEYKDAIAANERIDSHVKEAQLHLIDHVVNRFASTSDGVKHLANILGGDAKYGWASQVGFDGSERMSKEEQRRRRPVDPFLHAAIGLELADSSPVSAAEWFAKAAELVPQDVDPTVDIFDNDRAEFLLTASRIAERAARINAGTDKKLAIRAVEYYRSARTCLKNGDADWPQGEKLVYARACAIAGQTSQANTITESMLSKTPNDPALLYECAAVRSLLTESDTALDYLRSSFERQPRWQPATLLDTRFARLKNEREADLESICSNPLIGRWVTADDIWLYFYLDGTFRQVTKSKEKNGKFERLADNRLRLKAADNEATYPYKITKSKLYLGDKHEYVFDRTPRPLIGTWSYGAQTLEFREDGTLRKQTGTNVIVGTYIVLPPPSLGADHEFIVSNDAVVPGVIEERKFAFNVNKDNRLTIKVSGDPTEYEYKRK